MVSRPTLWRPKSDATIQKDATKRGARTIGNYQIRVPHETQHGLHWLRSLSSTGLTQSISVRFVFTYCAIIANQSYTKDFLNSAFKARHSNFQMFDKVNDDLYKRCLLLYFMLKKQELDQSQQEDKVYRFRTDFLNV